MHHILTSFKRQEEEKRETTYASYEKEKEQDHSKTNFKMEAYIIFYSYMKLVRHHPSLMKTYRFTL